MIQINTKGIKDLCNKYLAVLPFAILLFFMNFNTNSYGTSVGDIEIPIILACLLYVEVLILNSDKIVVNALDAVIVVAVALLAFVSTIFSDIVSITNDVAGLFACMLLFLYLTMYKYDKDMLKRIITCYKFIMAFVAFVIIVRAFANMDDKYTGRYTLIYKGIVKDPNYVSGNMCPAFMLALYDLFFSKESRFKNLVVALIIVIGVYYTGSRGAFLTMSFVTVVMLFYVAYRSGKVFKKENTLFLLIFFGLLVLVLIVALLIILNSSTTSRFFNLNAYKDEPRIMIWREGIKGFFYSPIIGSGIGGSSYFSLLGTGHYSSTHNAFLDILANLGIVGVIILAGLIFSIIYHANIGRMYVGLYLISALFPLVFLNGFESLGFWLPLIIAKNMANTMNDKKFKNNKPLKREL